MRVPRKPKKMRRSMRESMARKQARSQTFKDEAVKKVIKNNPEAVQKIKEDIILEEDLSTLNPYLEPDPINIDTSWFDKMEKQNNNDLTMLAIAGGGLLAGTAAGNSLSTAPAEPKLTEEQLIMLREAGLI